MTPAGIIAQIMTQLTNNATLATYVKGIFQGVRENVAVYPCIFIEPLSQEVTEERYGIETIKLRVALMCFVQVMEPEYQICGITGTKGVLDFENDVKIAIDSDRTIGGNAIHTVINGTQYEFSNFPERGITINLEILYQQTKGTRT